MESKIKSIETTVVGVTASIAVGPLLSGSSELSGRGATTRDVDETVTVEVWSVCELDVGEAVVRELNVGRVNVTRLVVVDLDDGVEV